MTTRLTWTTKLPIALVHETEAEARAYAAARLPGRACEPLNTREGWVIFNEAGTKMVRDR